MNSLVEFITKGRVGQLHIGQTRHDVLSALGDPTDWLGKVTVSH